tara:strand:- start:4885 stop:5796 length:912 start_codon:yes stop_codon:yes gene_type:complete
MKGHIDAVKSPLIRSGGKVKLIDTFLSSEIIKLYKGQGTDVSRFFQNEKVKLYKCLSSGYRFFYPNSVIGDAQFYKELSSTRPNYYSERWEHLKSLNFIKQSDNVLEIGSGFGSFLQKLKDLEINAEGIELNNHAVEHCKQQGLNVSGTLIEEFSKIYPNKFDVVCSFQVLEHVFEVHDFIQSQLNTLKSGGKLIVGVPNNNPYLFVSDKFHTLNLPPHHAGLWNKESLFSLEKIFNLKVEQIIFEPLEYTYDYFISCNIKQIKNKSFQKLIKKVEKKHRKRIRKYLPIYINGRNILVVYRKL